MSVQTRNEWKMNALSFAGHPAQKAEAERRLSSLAAATEKSLSRITVPMASDLSLSPTAILLGDRESLFAKSSAQVETLVLPQAAIPKSCELKLKDKEAKEGKRESPLPLRASGNQKEILRGKAKAAGVSLNRYILTAALGADYQPPHDSEWTKALLATNRELTRQGNNLNQIAHQRNANLIDEVETNSMLGIMARSYLQTQKAVRDALSQGKEMPPEP